MPKKPTPSTINQTAIGNENIQVVGSHNVITRITNFFAGDTEAQRAQRNRRAMLELVKNTWIKGVLEKSLYNEMLIELGMEERPGSVDHPWDIQVQMPNQPNRMLPPGTSISRVFSEMNGALLILGEPGSGKTTMLLELARNCISRAQQDNTQPIPAIFNLSSWSDPRQSMGDWLENELISKYNISRRLAEGWVTNDDLLVLLDGLDEVQPENREACVKAINNFRQEHGLTVPIAICSRVTDFEALSTKLNLHGAILLQPLTRRQIERYFEQAGSELRAAHQILKNDDILLEMVKWPFMLSIFMLAYQGATSEQVASKKIRTIRDHRRHLFNTYIQKMFARFARTRNESYSPEQTKRWLVWLAKKMINRGQSIFMLENIRQSWLQTRRQRELFHAYIILSFGLIGGLIGGLIAGLVGRLVFGTLLGSALGLAAGLLAREYSTRKYIELDLMFRTFRKNINLEKPTELLNWNWKKTLLGMAIGMFLGWLGGLSKVSGGYNGLVKYIFNLGLEKLASVLLSFWPVILGLIGMLIGGLVLGIEFTDIKMKTVPNQSIRQSLKNALIIWLIFSGFGGMVGGLINWLFGWSEINHSIGAVSGWVSYPIKIILGGLTFGFVEWLLVSLVLGFFVGMFFGGYAVFSHYILRFILYRNGNIPWDYVPFLDYCVDRIFLRRVGGGYIFVHRLLMEHFADMYSEGEK